VCRVLRPPPWRLQQQAVPYLSSSLRPMEVPQCSPTESLCWLNDASTHGFLDAARRLGIG